MFFLGGAVPQLTEDQLVPVGHHHQRVATVPHVVLPWEHTGDVVPVDQLLKQTRLNIKVVFWGGG